LQAYRRKFGAGRVRNLSNVGRAGRSFARASQGTWSITLHSNSVKELMGDLRVFTGNANRSLAAVCRHLSLLLTGEECVWRVLAINGQVSLRQVD